VVPNANIKVSFTLEGNGEIVATDNGDPADMTSFVSSERSSYNGLVLVIIRTKKGMTGKLKLTAKATGLASTQVEITSK
jgi:beta-galactosidase